MRKTKEMSVFLKNNKFYWVGSNARVVGRQFYVFCRVATTFLGIDSQCVIKLCSRSMNFWGLFDEVLK